MKKIYKLLSVVIGLALLCACFVGCNSKETTVKAEEFSYVSMRINPEIELVVNNDGEVVAVNAINEDGETVLCELDLIGMSVAEAGEAFTAMATELGFIDLDAEETHVYILAEGEDEEFVKEIEDQITNRINKYFDNKGIFGRVSPEDLQEFEALATEWNVSLKDARMISRILELYPEMTVEEVLSLDIEEKIKLIKDDSAKGGLPVHLHNEFKEALEQLKVEFARLFELEEELKQLKLQLEDSTLGEEELALIQENFDAKKAEFEALKLQYESALAQLKIEKLERIDEVKNQIRENARQRRNNFAGKLQEHQQNFEQNKEHIQSQIKAWRNTHK